MAWMQKLYATYENCAGQVEKIGKKLWPTAHMVKKAHVEIAIDQNGKFRRARKLLPTESDTLIPVTEASAGRTGKKIAPHPLCEEIGYCAADYPKIDQERHESYRNLMSEWCNSASHEKVNAVFRYVTRGTMWTDLSNNIELPIRFENKQGKKTIIKNDKIFIRWKVESPDDVCPETWKDDSLIAAWILFEESLDSKIGLCMAIGDEGRLSHNAPRFIRWSGDGAKIISSNDTSGYTFRGRFMAADQAAGVGFEVTQKAHNALRWLINRQGYRNGEQVFVSWAVAGKPVPDPFKNSLSLFLESEEIETTKTQNHAIDDPGDAGQAFALRLNKAISGYRARLDPVDDVVVMGLDSATPGRIAIIFYRELKGSEFLERIRAWHERYAWLQNFDKDRHFVGTPSPRDIAEAAFGRRLDEKLRKATVERLLPCIIDGRHVPRDLVISCVRRASNRFGKEHWAWEKCLGIACGMHKGYYKERGYKMTLEKLRATRDYLYGRLLAIADNIEGYALTLAEESKGRNTTAARLMQRFAERPFSTWRNIELALEPYKSRLRSSGKGIGFLLKREQIIDEIMCVFKADDFTSDTALSGEFLLGYHCQRSDLFRSSVDETADIDNETDKK